MKWKFLLSILSLILLIYIIVSYRFFSEPPTKKTKELDDNDVARGPVDDNTSVNNKKNLDNSSVSDTANNTNQPNYPNSRAPPNTQQINEADQKGTYTFF